MFRLIYMFRKYAFIVIVGGLIAMSTAYAAEQEPFWPQFHGPRRDNLSTEQGLLKKWPEKLRRYFPLMWRPASRPMERYRRSRISRVPVCGLLPMEKPMRVWADPYSGRNHYDTHASQNGF